MVWDVFTHAWDPIDVALANVHEHNASIGPVVGYGLVFFAGLGVGLIGLAYYERWLEHQRNHHLEAEPRSLGAMAITAPTRRAGVATWSAPRRLALLIAIGIGLHNFGEGLAIGQSAASGAIGLAKVLIIGFALHNATEGFGIVAPLAGDEERPSWTFLVALGAIGGIPTLIGTLVGYQFVSATLSVAFLTLAAGSILYVIVQLLGVALKAASKDLLYWGLLAGLAAGFITDMVVTAGGA